MKTSYQDKIDDYLLDRMPEEDIVQFEKSCSRNNGIGEQLAFTANVKDAITSRETKLKEMQSMKKAYDRRHKQQSARVLVNKEKSSDGKKSYNYKMLWTTAVAAVIVIGLFLAYPHSDQINSPSGFYDGANGREYFNNNMPSEVKNTYSDEGLLQNMNPELIEQKTALDTSQQYTVPEEIIQKFNNLSEE